VIIDGFPTHRSLSEVSPNNPVFLGHANGHTALINQAAMDVLNLNYNTPTPDGGVIVKDGKGDPTGILHENAIDLAYALTALSKESSMAAILAAQAHAFQWGITNFHDAGASSTDIDAQVTLDESKQLKLRVYTMVSAQDEALTDYWLDRPPLIADNESRLTIRSFKAVMDGALGSRTAWLHQPYTDDPGTSGVQTFDEDRLVDIMNRSNTHGWQINTHAIGDKANTVVLDAIDKASLTARDHRSRIEHSQHLAPSDVDRFASLGVIASIQAIHMSSDRPWAIDRLGKQRIESGAYIWRDLLNAGVHIANGTDVPVEPINPIANFYASVARKTLTGLPEGGFESDQKLSREEALKSMTLWNAYAAFEEAEVGSISVGKRADMTITDQNLMTIDEAGILATKPIMTIVGGEVVFSSM
jgi:predicted amidohydrolase YtcJ